MVPLTNYDTMANRLSKASFHIMMVPADVHINVIEQGMELILWKCNQANGQMTEDGHREKKPRCISGRVRCKALAQVQQSFYQV